MKVLKYSKFIRHFDTIKTIRNTQWTKEKKNYFAVLVCADVFMFILLIPVVKLE